jgi:translation elongation factor EF-G
VLNTVKDKKERVGRLLEMHAIERTDIDCSDAAQDRTCTARAVVRSGHRTTARAMKKN